MTVCYGVLFHGWDRYRTLLQNIEYNKLMGAEHFFVYNMSTGPRISALLNFYSKKGILTVLDMPKYPSNLAWYHGQITAINDCVSRNRNVSQFVAVLDPDEYIMPLKHLNWQDMLYDIEKKEKQKKLNPLISSFSFKHAYYCYNTLQSHQWSKFIEEYRITKDDREFIKDNRVDLLLETYRRHFMEYPVRSKTILRPELVREPGVHFTRRVWHNASIVVVNETIGFLGHHRHTKGECFPESPFSQWKQYLDLVKKSHIEFQNLLET